MNKLWLIGLLLLISPQSFAATENDGQWHGSAGAHFFKFSAEQDPNEIAYNAVFKKWETINQSKQTYTIKQYQKLKPLYFNFNFGFDLFFQHGNLMIKVGYDYSNPMGIGGKGQIEYQDKITGITTTEKKEFSYTTHQINCFIGPVIQTPDHADIYLGFCPMAPTWVTYHENYSKSENDKSIVSESRTWNGFFGNCRAVIGAEAPMSDQWKLGSEGVFSFLNYMELTSGDLTDASFRFPMMKWNVTARREMF